jgi:LacI family transcriptional regulator
MNQIIGDKCPVVFFDRKPLGFHRDSVMSTNFQGAFEGTSILLDRGNTRLGFIGSHFDITMNERFEGFRSAILQKGIPFYDELVEFGSIHNKTFKELKFGECYDIAKDFVENKRVKTIFCGNDITSIGVINYLKEHNIKVPEEVDVVCFDDTVWLPLTYKSICAIDQDWTNIASTVVLTLLGRIKKTNGEPFSEKRIPTKLIVR